MSIYDASEETGTPVTPSSGRQVIYPKSGGWYVKNSAGVEVQLAPLDSPTFTGGVTIPAGTVSAPSLTLSTDTTTGLYRIGANNDGYAVSGSKVLDIGSTGLAVTGTISASSQAASLTIGQASAYGTVVGVGNAGIIYINSSDRGGATGSGTANGCINLSTDETLRYSSISGTDRAVFSSTGLAVTGTLSASSEITGTSQRLSSGTSSTTLASNYALRLTAGATAANYSGLFFDGSTSYDSFFGRVPTALSGINDGIGYVTYSGGVPTLGTLFSSTGLAVTGSITSTVPAAGAFTTLSATGSVSVPRNGASILATGGTQAGVKWGSDSSCYFDSDATLLFRVGGATSFYTAGAFSATGVLSLYNGLAVTGTVSATTGAAVGGATAGAGGIAFPATQVAVADPNTLDDYDEYTAASAACTGAITTTAVWRLTKVGNVVTLTLPDTIGTATAAPSFDYGTAIPAKYRPSAALRAAAGVVADNNAVLQPPGQIYINASSGVITFYRDASSTNFTAAPVAGHLGSVGISWTI